MKYVYKIFSVVLIASLLFTLVGCSLFNRDIDNNSSINSSDFTSSEHVSSDEETSSPDETISSENEDLSSNSGNTTADTSSNTTKPSGSTNSSGVSYCKNCGANLGGSRFCGNCGTIGGGTTNPNTSSNMSWKEKIESRGYEVLYDENVSIYYYSVAPGYSNWIYEKIYDGVNTERKPRYTEWDPVLKLYYTVVEGETMSYYDGGWKGYTEHSLWSEKYRNGYWKIDYKRYTEGTIVLLKEYEYEEDESYDSSNPKCSKCGKALGNGTNGTCNRLMLSLCKWRCLICNTIVEAGGCHTCPDGYYSDLEDYLVIEKVR